jgi:hypothetical protein
MVGSMLTLPLPEQGRDRVDASPDEGKSPLHPPTMDGLLLLALFIFRFFEVAIGFYRCSNRFTDVAVSLQMLQHTMLCSNHSLPMLQLLPMNVAIVVVGHTPRVLMQGRKKTDSY